MPARRATTQGRSFVKRSEVPAGWMSRSKLARAAGVTRATVKHYNDLGLLPPALFTGPNMAYYGPECVDRIRLIRELRSQRQLPLQAIAEMLESRGADHVARALQHARALQADLLDALAGERDRPVSRERLLAVAGLDAEVLAELEALGLIRALPGSGAAAYDALSLRVAEAVGVMRAEGLTEQAGFRVSDLRLYRDRLRALVRAEVQLFSSRVLGRFDERTEERFMRAALRRVDALVLAARDRALADLLEEDGPPQRSSSASR